MAKDTFKRIILRDWLQGNNWLLGLCCSQSTPPIAKKDKYGNVITNQGALKDLYLETYTERLKHRQIKEESEDIFKLKSLLWKKRLSILKTVETRPWTPNDLGKLIKKLKRNLSIDPNNMINEKNLPAAMGSNLKSGLLKLIN